MNVRDKNQFQLLSQSRFAPFFITQFLGAFNDNFYKNAMLILIAFQGSRMTNMNPDIVIQLAGGLFILPFFLLSATAGQLADKYDKAYLTQWVKLLEIAAMCLGAIGFYLHNLPVLMVALLLMGLHSTVFGPIKYAILPQHLASDELIGGNGLVEMGTNIAILLGTMLSGMIIGMHYGTLFVSLLAIGFALLGYVASRRIPAAPAVSRHLLINWNIITATRDNLVHIKKNKTLFLSILAISWFWSFGLIFLSQFPNLTKVVLQGDETVVSLLLTLFSIGIGTGSLLCEKLARHKLELGLIPFGAIGISLFGLDFYFACAHYTAPTSSNAGHFLTSLSNARLMIDLSLMGLCSGFFIVPLYALIQIKSRRAERSRIIAGNNILNAFAMVMAVIMVVALFKLGANIPQVLLATVLIHIIITGYIVKLMPGSLIRFLSTRFFGQHKQRHYKTYK